MRILRLAFLLTLVLSSVLLAENWPQFRGPMSSGVSAEKGLPTRWSTADGVAWRARLAGLGVSSPIVWGDRIFVASQIGRVALAPGSHPTLAGGRDVPAELERPLGGARPAGSDPEVTFVVEAFQRTDGRRVWQHRVAAEGKLAQVHQKHNLASLTPVTDGERVYAIFATGQLVALDMNGAAVWQKHLGEMYGAFEITWGAGSSPVLHRDLLILLCDYEPASYVLALDKRTGQERWKADRGTSRFSYSTPVVVPGPGGDELIVNSSERVDAYDPATGSFLWHTDEPNRFPIPTPVYNNGVLYLSRGYRSGPYMAIKLGGRGDISKTHVPWRVPTGAPYISSLLYYEGLLYMATDGGIVTAVDATTGQRIYQQRVGAIFAASPVAADGRVYLFSETGETVIIRAGREFEILARNDLGARIVASPAVSGGRIYIRTDDQLVAIGS